MTIEWLDAKRLTEVGGKKMGFVEMGEGDPIIFLHGNPTSSFLWRKIVPHLTEQGRCIAPDLIGMGDSEKLDNSGPDRYRFVEHREFLDGLLDKLGVKENATFVVHDWGGALGFDWGFRNQDAIKGFIYMETVVQPVEWSDWPEAARNIFQAMRSEAGEEMVLEKNVFVERILPASVLNPIPEEDMAIYLHPFREPGESRRPTLTWPRQIPIGGEPADVTEIVNRYSKWLSESEIPKLFINADPGSILVGPQREFCRTWPNQTEVTVPGSHFIQEDSPNEIATAIKDWLS